MAPTETLAEQHARRCRAHRHLATTELLTSRLSAARRRNALPYRLGRGTAGGRHACAAARRRHVP